MVFLRQEPDAPGWELVALGPQLRSPGLGLKLHDMRAFLWKNRLARRNGRGNAVLWAWYDPGKDVSRMGLGAFVRADVAARFGRMFPSADTSVGAGP